MLSAEIQQLAETKMALPPGETQLGEVFKLPDPSACAKANLQPALTLANMRMVLQYALKGCRFADT